MSCSTLQTIASVTAAIAAAFALYFAWRTVDESRKLRREERMERLIGIVSELAFAMRRGAQGSAIHLSDVIPLLQLRLSLGLGTLDSPNADALTVASKAEISGQADAGALSLEDIQRMASSAIEEISRQLSPE
jgi:hypothetical protein